MRLPIEVLEGRRLLSNVFVVTKTLDDGSSGTLRWAIGQVNADATDTQGQHDQIRFASPATDPGHSATTGVWTIAPATALPALTRAVVIDGYTQKGAAANTSATADNAVLKVQLVGPFTSYGFPAFAGLEFGDGSGGAGTAPGLVSGVRGLAFNTFATDVLIDASNIFVQGCFLGTTAAGTVPAGTVPAFFGSSGNSGE